VGCNAPKSATQKPGLPGFLGWMVLCGVFGAFFGAFRGAWVLLGACVRHLALGDEYGCVGVVLVVGAQ
jgi:hypothetical protein